MENIKSPFHDNAIKKYSVRSLIEQFYEGKELEYVFFWNTDKINLSVGCFSQWQKAYFKADGYEYCCAEQYMMGQKALIFNDSESFEKILSANHPKTIKELGRKVKNFDGNEWDKIKYKIVLNGNFYKFTQNKEMMEILISTGKKILVEASPFDKIWGVGLDEKNEKIYNPNYWEGENLLGFALMELRDVLDNQ
ncbi:MAG: NADAR family protein [Prevotellaceae bacterium]|jgi:ribA/ribD-fused uncharacterized protein|nr:NADAR family protein [Prevotellaceae bacterium]